MQGIAAAESLGKIDAETAKMAERQCMEFVESSSGQDHYWCGALPLRKKEIIQLHGRMDGEKIVPCSENGFFDIREVGKYPGFSGNGKR